MPAKKTAKKKSVPRKGPTKKVPLSPVPPKYTVEQLANMLWAAFGKGAGLPFANDVITTGTARFTAIVTTNNNNGTFTDAMVEETKLCAQRGGEIATSVALFRKHTEISATDFSNAADLLESIASGGQGGLC
jgi:hypothetical protein